MFELSIATPEKVFYEDRVESVTAPGADGYLGVLSHHAPLITTLLPGKVVVRDNEKQTMVFAVSGGFLEVSRNQATLLADAVELAEQINVDRARRALGRAQERIRRKDPGVDLSRALEALKRAENRIQISEEQNKKP
jgi:F-type H+-transporting ATPase subunit epsilon